MAFNIGDTVRVINRGSKHGLYGVITAQSKFKDVHKVKFSETCECAFYTNELEAFVEAPAAGKATDLINHPPHYTQGGVECIDAIKAALTPDEWRGYCKGNALKYVWRELHKGGDESLQKAVWYLKKLLGEL